MWGSSVRAEEVRDRRFLMGTFLVAVAYLVTMKFEIFLGFRPDLMLAALVALAFFLSFSELFFLTSLSVFLMLFAPWWMPDLLIFALAPLTVFFFRRTIFPFESWFGAALAVIFAITLLYVLPGVLSGGDACISMRSYLTGCFLANGAGAGIFFQTVLSSLLFGLLIFELLRSVYDVTAHS